MSDKFRYYFKKLPLIGGLADCTIIDHFNAIKELLLTIFFSTLPILIALLVDHYTKDHGIIQSLNGSIGNGELFLYSTSLLAPVFYTVMNERGEIKTYPGKSSAIWVYIIIMGISATIFALQRANVVLHTEQLYGDSIKMFCVSVILLYLVIVINNNRVAGNPSKEMQKQEDEFKDKYKKHRGN